MLQMTTTFADNMHHRHLPVTILLLATKTAPPNTRRRPLGCPRINVVEDYSGFENQLNNLSQMKQLTWLRIIHSKAKSI